VRAQRHAEDVAEFAVQVGAYFGDRDRSFRLKVTGHFGAS